MSESQVDKLKKLANEYMDLVENNYRYWKAVLEKKIYGGEEEKEDAKDP